jgi:hypothetical protein
MGTEMEIMEAALPAPFRVFRDIFAIMPLKYRLFSRMQMKFIGRTGGKEKGDGGR